MFSYSLLLTVTLHFYFVTGSTRSYRPTGSDRSAWPSGEYCPLVAEIPSLTIKPPGKHYRGWQLLPGAADAQYVFRPLLLAAAGGGGDGALCLSRVFAELR